MKEVKLTKELVKYLENETYITQPNNEVYILTLSNTYMFKDDKWYIVEDNELPEGIIYWYKDALNWRLEKLNKII